MRRPGLTPTGSNAGHSLVHDGQSFAFNLIPCGILQPECVNVVGAGTVVHVPSFLKEIEGLEAKGVPYKNKLFLSDRGMFML
jgi:adenylosuccinate synthase